MSHIPQAKTGLKPPSKVHKPVQGGGGSATSPTNSSTGVVRPRGNPAQRPVSTPGAIKTSPSSKSTTGSGVVRPRGSASNAGLVSPRGSVHATSGQQMVPKLSRENSQTRLQYRREGSNVSLPSTGSDSSEPVVRRRGSSSSQQGATSAADLKKFFKIGDRVLVSGTKPGVIGFIGETKFAKGDWAGVMLDEPTGKNDGSVAGVRYFDCEPLHGVFTKLEKMTKINKVNVTHHSESSTTALEIGDRVVVSGTKIGTVRYVGITGFAKGDWAGVELDEPLGKNDGAVAGTRYFQCQQDFGLFAPIHKVIKTGKKESTKLPFSPPPPPPEKEPPLSIPNQLKESLLNSVSESIQNQAKSESSVSSPESIPLSASSTLTNAGPKNEAESQDRPDVNPGKAPAHVSLQLVALQEALQEREREIQALLEERDFERNEVASATSQVSKAEEELVNIKKKHEEAVTDNAKRIQELKNLIDLAEKEKADLYLQVEEEKRKNEDLQFKLEEEEIILGDELKTEEEQIKDLTQKLQEKEDKVNKLTEELEQSKAGRSSTAIKLKEKEHELLESKEQLSSLQVSLEESQNKVQQLEAKVSLMEEKHTADSSQASQGMKEHLEKIKQLENVLNISNEKEKRCQTTIENTKYELKISQEENDSLRVQIEDLSAKLISKENEFDVMSDELKQIKLATLELQKQLQISEAKTMNLTSDKKKMECEIAEIMKNSGNNSERLTYLNEQLREKDRMLDELKGASAESHIHIERLTKDVAEAKECHSKDLEKLSKSHDEQTKKLINQINSLKTEVEKHKDANHSLVQMHKQELEKVEQIKSLESSSLTSRINQQTEQLQQISQDLSKTKNELQAVMQDRDKTKEVNNAKQTEVNTYKAELNKSKLLLDNFAKELEETKLQLQSTAQDRDSVKEKCCQYEIEIEAKQNEISQVTLKLDAAVSEKGLLTRTQGETEKKISEVMEKYEKLNSDYQAVLLEKNEKIKICEENENKVKTLNLEKETILQDKHNTRTKLDELQAKYNMLKKETDAIKAQSAQQEEELTLLRSSASDKLSEMTKLQSQMNQVTAERDQFKRKVVVLEEQGNLFQDKVKSLEQEKTLIQSQKNQVAEALAKAQHEVISLNARLHERPTSLASEISNIGLENDLEAIKHELKIKDEEIVKCKQQVLDVKKQMVAGATQDTADLAVKLTETEDLLEATTAEKENLDAQVEFLNSVIVDLQRKNEENEQRIELLMLGETRSANGLLESPEMDEAPIPRYKVRLFCDICDVFDEHDTDDCPAQASEAPDVGSMHHGSRTEARPYCITCEVFGHWTEDCDDEETF